MFDIDKYLNEMEIKDMEIDKELLTRTKKRCKEEQWKAHEQQGFSKLKKAILVAIPTAAVILIGLLVISWLFLGSVLFPNTDLFTVAYYTVDVNPSICVHVDKDGSVTSVVSQNADAQAIVDKLDVKGDSVTDAIKKVLAAIKDAGYFDAGQRYVLIGCFAADGTMLKSTMADLQAQLEADFGDMIDLLLVSGSLEDLQEANQLKVSAGLLKLAQLADDVDVTDKNVEDVINCIDQENYFAPGLSASVTDKINLSWDEINFEEMGYAGKVKYSIAAGDTEEEAKSGDAPIVKAVSFYTYGEQTLSASVALDPGVTKYFALYAQYGDAVKLSNVVKATMPGEYVPSPSPSEEPGPSDTPLSPHTMTGRISGDKVVLSWSKETAENFAGYKVVASKDVENPSYPDNGYIKYITNRDTTSVSVYAGFAGLEANTYYYFSITYLYDGSPNVVANAVRLKVPPRSETPSNDYPVSNITSASISADGTVTLHWSGVSGDIEYFKVVGSCEESKPVYPADGYIDVTNNTSGTYSLADMAGVDGFGPGKTCYFSITTVYTDGTKVPGNVKTLVLPSSGHNATTISGSIDADGNVSLNWDPINDPWFAKYKLIYQIGGDEYCKEYKNRDSITFSKNISGTPGVECTFRVMVVYLDGVCSDYSNSVSYTYTPPEPSPSEPEPSPSEPEPTPTPSV